MKNNHTPEIRFPGYTGNWEEYKLGDIAEKVSVGIATSSSQYFSHKSQGIPFIKNQNVKENWIDSSDLEYISREFDQANATKRVREGDILTVRTGYPGLSAVVPKELEGAQTFTTLITRLKKDTAIPEFISAFINSDTGMKQILGMEAGGAQKNVNAGILKELLIQLPSLEEQKKVSNFIKELSNTIALHQQKLTILKQTKQGFLQKMFPKEGESVPEVRFPGFTGEWEESELGAVIENMYNGQTPSRFNDENWNGEINWLSSGELNRGVVTTTIEKITLTGQKDANLRIVPKGTFVMAITGLEAAGTRGNCAMLSIDTTLNQSCMAIFPKESVLDSVFLFQWYRKVGEEYGIRYTQGTKQQSYNAELIKLLPIIVPKIEEQIKIGNFFKQLDDTITLHQRELDALKETKKAFLQKMFA